MICASCITDSHTVETKFLSWLESLLGNSVLFPIVSMQTYVYAAAIVDIDARCTMHDARAHITSAESTERLRGPGNRPGCRQFRLSLSSGDKLHSFFAGYPMDTYKHSGP